MGTLLMVYNIGILIMIGLYAFHAGGEYIMLKRMQYDRPWLAWIPICNLYATADVATRGLEKVRFHKWEVKTEWFRFWFIAAFAVNFIPLVGGFAMMAVSIVSRYICYSNIFSYCENKELKEVEKISWVAAVVTIVATVKFYLYATAKKNHQTVVEA